MDGSRRTANSQWVSQTPVDVNTLSQPAQNCTRRIGQDSTLLPVNCSRQERPLCLLDAWANTQTSRRALLTLPNGFVVILTKSLLLLQTIVS
jgi:hypothetical protein